MLENCLLQDHSRLAKHAWVITADRWCWYIIINIICQFGSISKLRDLQKFTRFALVRMICHALNVKAWHATAFTEEDLGAHLSLQVAFLY